MTNQKKVSQQQEWSLVARELESENLKLAAYDKPLLSEIGDLHDKKIFDYGGGPGILALAIQKLGGAVKFYDINPEMIEKAAAKIGKENTYSKFDDVPKDAFDIVICNLVLCIVPEKEVQQIIHNIRDILRLGGVAYIGFCNPKVFNIPESNIDFRFPTGARYEENHDYKKIKKEGGYEITESHRPIEWYEKVYQNAGLELTDKLYTPEYELKGNKIEDFIIFKLTK